MVPVEVFRRASFILQCKKTGVDATNLAMTMLFDKSKIETARSWKGCWLRRKPPQETHAFYALVALGGLPRARGRQRAAAAAAKGPACLN